MGLKMPQGMSNVVSMNENSSIYDVAVVGGGPAGLAAAIAICGAVPAHADPVAGNPDRRILRERPIQENHVGGGKYILPYNFDLVDPMEGKGASTPTWRLPFGASPLTLSRCTLSIAGGPVIDAKGCPYRKAEQGFAVTAFDFAPNAQAKAARLAKRRDVRVDHQLGDMDTWRWAARQYDALVAVFIQFMAPRRREVAFAGMMSAIVPGGVFLLEGYRPEQVDYRTGGPPDRENMYTRQWLETTFAGWQILVLEAYDAAIAEGDAHSGMSALIDLVARKP